MAVKGRRGTFTPPYFDDCRLLFLQQGIDKQPGSTTDFVIIRPDERGIFLRVNFPVYYNGWDSSPVGFDSCRCYRFRFIGGNNNKIDPLFYQLTNLFDLSIIIFTGVLHIKSHPRIVGSLHLHIQHHRFPPAIVNRAMGNTHNKLLFLPSPPTGNC